jgi:hypothetical protein
MHAARSDPVPADYVGEDVSITVAVYNETNNGTCTIGSCSGTCSLITI